jgi:hypothetical protein
MDREVITVMILQLEGPEIIPCSPWWGLLGSQMYLLGIFISRDCSHSYRSQTRTKQDGAPVVLVPGPRPT